MASLAAPSRQPAHLRTVRSGDGVPAAALRRPTTSASITPRSNRRFGQAQFDVLNYPSINGNYMMTSTDNHRPEMVANGNELAQFYNWLTDRYDRADASKNGAAAADVINHVHGQQLDATTAPGPKWIVLNEISSSLWSANPRLPEHFDLSHLAHRLRHPTARRTHGYNVVTLAPFQNPAQNNASWQALSAIEDRTSASSAT